MNQQLRLALRLFLGVSALGYLPAAATAQEAPHRLPEPPTSTPSLVGSELFPPTANVAGLLSWKVLTAQLDPAAAVQLRAIALAMSPKWLRKRITRLGEPEEVGLFTVPGAQGLSRAIFARAAKRTTTPARGAETPALPAPPRDSTQNGVTSTGDAEATTALRKHLDGGGGGLLAGPLGGVLSRLEGRSALWAGAELPPGAQRLLVSLMRQLAPGATTPAAPPTRLAAGVGEVAGRAELRLVAEFVSPEEALPAQSVLEQATQTALALLSSARLQAQHPDHARAVEEARALSVRLLKSLAVSLDGRFLDARFTSPLGLAQTLHVFTRALVPMFSTYLARSKTVEALVELRRLAQLAGAHLRTLPRDADGRPVAERLLPPAPRTPDASACDLPDQRFPASRARFDHPTWKALDFALHTPHYYRYELETRIEGTNLHFRAIASADLDCNGVFSRYELAGSVGADGEVKLEPLKTENPLE